MVAEAEDARQAAEALEGFQLTNTVVDHGTPAPSPLGAPRAHGVRRQIGGPRVPRERLGEWCSVVVPTLARLRRPRPLRANACPAPQCHAIQTLNPNAIAAAATNTASIAA